MAAVSLNAQRHHDQHRNNSSLIAHRPSASVGWFPVAVCE